MGKRASSGVGGTLVYDSDCGFCTVSAAWLQRHVNTKGRLRIVGSRDADLSALGLTPAQCDEAVQFVGSDHSSSSGHRAIADVLSLGGGAWPVLGYIGSRCWLNWPLARIYALIARNRHKLPGGTAACQLSEEAGRPPRV